MISTSTTPADTPAIMGVIDCGTIADPVGDGREVIYTRLLDKSSVVQTIGMASWLSGSSAQIASYILCTPIHVDPL